MVASGRRALLVLTAICAVACGDRGPAAPPDPHADALARLRIFEASRRAATDFARLPTSDRITGADPVAVRRLPGTALVVGLLRGRSAIVLLESDGREVQRLEAPASPTGLAVASDGAILAGGELEPTLARWVLEDGRLRRSATITLGDVRGVRDVAVGPEGLAYVVEDHDHRLVTLDAAGTVLDAAPVGLGPRFVLRTARHVVVDCILSHEVVVLPLDARGVPRWADVVRIVQDGPLWAIDAVETADGVMVAMGGIEDHPLDRRQGSFGYVDSFAYVYRIAPRPERVATVNVSALGVVTPKVIRLTVDGERVALRLTGYGDANLADLVWERPRVRRDGRWPAPRHTTRPLVPGTVAAAELDGGRTILADPLLDAWVVDDGATPRVVPVSDADGPPRTVASRVGEALLFTTLIAPWNRTKGPVSRFSCEACHFEGRVDGRIHDTGRGDVHVVTRPLLGLFNNRPHFSRALDPDLTAVADNEFRVAGRRSRHDPWFAIHPSEVPWLVHLGVGAAGMSAEELRRALMTFLMEYTHRPNPVAPGRTEWTAEERRGADIFRDRCEGCHQARLVTDRADTRVPFGAWESLVLSPEGPLVWARETYERTGVEPYVHERGTRVPPLRRLYVKRPYFTTGGAADLDEVLRRARFAETEFRHDGGKGTPLEDTSRSALRAFLDLL